MAASWQEVIAGVTSTTRVRGVHHWPMPLIVPCGWVVMAANGNRSCVMERGVLDRLLRFGEGPVFDYIVRCLRPLGADPALDGEGSD